MSIYTENKRKYKPKRIDSLLLNFFLDIHTFSLLFQHQNKAWTSFFWMILPHLRAMSIAQILAVLGKFGDGALLLKYV